MQLRFSSTLKMQTINAKNTSGLGQLVSRQYLDYLSPLLANIYLSDLHEHLEQSHNFAPIVSEESVTSITWADDLLILSLHRDGLQNCLGNLNSYTRK